MDMMRWLHYKNDTIETPTRKLLKNEHIDLMKRGLINAEEVICDSDEFEAERVCNADGGSGGDAGTNAVQAWNDTEACNESGTSDIVEKTFITKLDTLWLALSMDIADLSALIYDVDYGQDSPTLSDYIIDFRTSVWGF